MSSVVEQPACWREIGVYGSGSCEELIRYVHCRNCPRFADAARTLLVRNAGRSALDPSPPAAQSASAQILRERQLRGALVFRLGELVLALDADYCSELAPDQRARRIAHRSGGLLEGLVNIRGELLLCVALDQCLGISREPSPSAVASARLVVVRGTGEPWAFRATAVRGIERYDEAAIEAPPPAMPTGLATRVRGLVALVFSQVARKDWPERVVLLDGPAVLSALESAVY